MRQIKVKVNAKINLSLNVLDEANGYHNLDSVVASLNISDVVFVDKRYDKRVFVGMNAHKVTDKNTALLVAKTIVETYGVSGVDIFLHKTIPLMGGLGGSSADCAAVMVAMSKMFHLPMDKKFLEIGDAIGSDVRYMLGGGYARITGRGEIVQRFKADTTLYFVMIKPNLGLSTGKVFENFRQDASLVHCDNDKLIEAIKTNDIGYISDNNSNDLLSSAIEVMPMLSSYILQINSVCNKKVFMSGSGSCLFVLCDDFDESVELSTKLREKGLYAKYCQTKQSGIEIIK